MLEELEVENVTVGLELYTSSSGYNIQALEATTIQS